MSAQRDRDAPIGGASAEGRPSDARPEPVEAAVRAAEPAAAAASSKRVSVIIPAYNVAPYVAEALASVFAQRLAPQEVVLVNDGSSDREALEREIEPFRDRIIYIKQPNKGAAAARNTAVRAASGDLVAFLDGDDAWMPDFLESQLAFLEKTGFDMVYSDASIFGEGIDTPRTFMAVCPSRGEVTPLSLIQMTCNVITSGTVVRRERIVSAGFFDESPQWRRGQDFEMWFRLAKLGAKIGYQERVLLKYRQRPENLSGTELDRSMRDLWSLLGIKAKFEFTPTEQKALDQKIAEVAALCQVELGKTQLLRGQFDEARSNFAAANRHLRRWKLSVVCFLLSFVPGAVQRVLRRHSARRTDDDRRDGGVTRGPKLTPTVTPAR
jgi:glycosyltransferase involved in cell wall biosynthesis